MLSKLYHDLLPLGRTHYYHRNHSFNHTLPPPLTMLSLLLSLYSPSSSQAAVPVKCNSLPAITKPCRTSTRCTKVRHIELSTCSTLLICMLCSTYSTLQASSQLYLFFLSPCIAVTLPLSHLASALSYNAYPYPSFPSLAHHDFTLLRFASIIF